MQNKVRADVSSEYWLDMSCAYPDKQLFDWGMMRLPRPLYGVADIFAMEADDRLKKKRDAEVIFVILSVIYFRHLIYMEEEPGNMGRI